MHQIWECGGQELASPPQVVNKLNFRLWIGFCSIRQKVALVYCSKIIDVACCKVCCGIDDGPMQDVKDFYANLAILPGDNDVLTSKVKNTNIIMDLEAFGDCLGVPFVGQAFHHGLVPKWDGYKKMDYYFHICYVSQQDILSKKNPASSRLLLFSKNFIIQVNWAYTIMYHMKNQQSLTGGLPYARLITKFLEGCGIDMKRESKKKISARECEEYWYLFGQG
ncbi:hypothetical protein KIW84_072018 [Lathyrus oleraceus]|uniref:Uncharacterized protein n=1 Tax=Pisum sativum TaxID=3888 RepID=A0A9D4ZWM3_PEA|nr:hypothetical protein KIW84_072018 [Pisum sativum]